MLSRKAAIVVLSLALLFAVAWGLWERANRITLANAVEAGGQRDFYNLLNSVEQVQVNLNKYLASNSSRQQAVHLTEAWTQANAAHLALSQLPMPGINLVNTSKFLAQAGDYCHYLAQKLASGDNLTSEEREQVARLRNEMEQMMSELRQTERQVADNTLRWSNFYNKSMPAPLQTIANLAVPVQARPDPLDGFVNTDRYLQTLPTLNYDGPFSDHMEKQRPVGLTGGAITQSEAESRALAFVNDASNGNCQVRDTRTSSGRFSTFAVNITDPNRPDVLIHTDISKQGGKIISMLNNRAVDNPTLEPEKAVERATEFLKKQGLQNMQPTYSIRSDNNMVITFAATMEDVLLYPDQVKVKVALDNGEITGWDAAQYYMSHHQRQLPQPKLTPEQARQKINPQAKIEGIRKALIPLPGGTEKFTYEVNTKIDDSRFLIYINALTGQEERIMQIIDVPGGQLTM